MAKKEKSCACRLISMGITFLIIGGGAYAAWFFTGKKSVDELVDIAIGVGDKIKEIDFGDLTGALENFTGFTPELWDEDPFVGDNTTNLWRGYTKGSGGLTLELWNALDESWQEEYVEALDDWNNWCDVKVLDLSSKDVDVDNACTEVDGVMKVCNGNYGETGWLGINEVLKTVPDGIIQWSRAKMNEHYLLNADYDERLYTMCHEMGHGYGLPHTDENFNNKDQGNCLDYTNRPSNNLRPGKANCDRLLGMYGSVDGTISNRMRRTRALRYRSDAEIYEDFAEEDDEFSNDDAQYYYEYARSQFPNMTAEYEEALHELYYDIANGNHEQYEHQQEVEETVRTEQKVRGKWRRLREHRRGGDFARRLNSGFVLEVHVLYPNPSTYN